MAKTKRQVRISSVLCLVALGLLLAPALSGARVEALRPGPLPPPPDAVRSMAEDRSGTLWIGASSGLYRLDRETGQAVRAVAASIPLSWYMLGRGLGKWRFSVLVDGAGSVWYGTPGDGLYHLDGDRLTLYQADAADPASLSSNLVSALYEDGVGSLWVGTGAGLDRFEPATGIFAHLRVQDGLPRNEIRAIVKDDVPAEQGGPYLWISTVRGLARLDRGTDTFHALDLVDGLQSAEFCAGAVYKNAGGALFFGGINGVSNGDGRQPRLNSAASSHPSRCCTLCGAGATRSFTTRHALHPPSVSHLGANLENATGCGKTCARLGLADFDRR